MEKSALRKAFLQQRMEISAEQRAVSGKKICEQLFGFIKGKKELTSVCLYSAIKNEIDLIFLMEKLFGQIDIALPVIIPERVIEFYLWTKESPLHPNMQNLLEPDPKTARKLEPSEKTLVISPALAIDESGYRLGYGGGFYDKFFCKYKNVESIAVSYEQFCIKKLVRDEWDQAVHWICNEKGIIRAKS